MRTFKLFEQWEDNDETYTADDLVLILDSHVETAGLPAVLESAQGLTQIPDTAFFVVPVDDTPQSALNTRLTAELYRLARHLTQAALTDDQVFEAVQSVVDEVKELRDMRASLRAFVLDSSQATANTRLYDILSEDAPF